MRAFKSQFLIFRAATTAVVSAHWWDHVDCTAWQGLLALANVINVLSDMSDNPDARTTLTHVPYRDHKLTRLLRNSVRVWDCGGRSKLQRRNHKICAH